MQVAKDRSPSPLSRDTLQNFSLKGIFPYLWLVAAVLVWGVSLQWVEPRAMNDLGLVSALPPGIFVGLFLVTVGFALNLRAAWFNEWRLFLYVLTLMVMLYGITALVFPTPRFATTWKLVGVTDFVINTGTVSPRVDAFMNWPGFFIFSAALTEAMGLDTPLRFAAWAHLGFNLLYFAPLFTIFTTVTKDRRVVWSALWLFYATNWIGQDYLSPQAFGYFFFLMTIAICLRWFRVQVPTHLNGAGSWMERGRATVAHIVAGWRDSELLELENRTSTPMQRAGLLLLIVLMVAALIPTHQLTPFAIAGVLLALIVTNRITPRYLPIIIGVLAFTWLSFAAILYLKGNVDKLVGPLGQVTDNVSRSVDRRVAGSPEHIFVVQMRLFMSLAFWGLAGLGGVRRLRAGYVDLTMGLLALTPFVLLGVQAYGGELILRIYFFALPGMAYFAARLFFPSEGKAISWRTPAALAAVTVLLLAGFQFTRYGNEKADYFSPAEWEASEVLYDDAGGRSLIMAVTNDLPWRYREYADHKYVVIDSYVRRDDLAGLLEWMTEPQYQDSYVIVTTGQYAGAEIFLGMTDEQINHFLGEMLASGKFDILYQNEDAVIYRLKAEARQTRPLTQGQVPS